MPIGPVFSCPKEHFCTGSSAAACSTNTTLAACTVCDRCSSDNRFACTSRNTYAFCLGIYSTRGTCVGDFVCNVQNPNMCGSPVLWEPSCFGTDSVGCPHVDTATEYCRSIGRRGRFPNVEDTSVSIKQYINCYYFGDMFWGKVYSCPGSTYFDSTTQICTTQFI
ncbi:hypothetical protein KR084_004871 [Drosophila pseudotakahashii]|nr:hypothetical protein KR084_004871 [Drosophila pseudotakahashii]